MTDWTVFLGGSVCSLLFHIPTQTHTDTQTHRQKESRTYTDPDAQTHRHTNTHTDSLTLTQVPHLAAKNSYEAVLNAQFTFVDDVWAS